MSVSAPFVTRMTLVYFDYVVILSVFYVVLVLLVLGAIILFNIRLPYLGDNFI